MAMQVSVCSVCRLKLTLPLHSNNFNDVLTNDFKETNFSKVPSYAPWWWSEETETCRSHIRKDILNINCSILRFNKRCICWQNNFVIFMFAARLLRHWRLWIRLKHDHMFLVVILNSLYERRFKFLCFPLRGATFVFNFGTVVTLE